MTISKREFGILCDGTLVSCWTLKGENGVTAEILDYGVTSRSIIVPDKKGMYIGCYIVFDKAHSLVAV